MDQEAWCAAVHGVARSQTRLSDWTELKCLPSDKTLKMKFLFIDIWREWELVYQLFPPKTTMFSLCWINLGCNQIWRKREIFLLTLIFEPKMKYLVFIWKHHLKLNACDNSDLVLGASPLIYLFLKLSRYFAFMSFLPWSPLNCQRRLYFKYTIFSFTPAFQSFSELGLWNIIHQGLDTFS